MYIRTKIGLLLGGLLIAFAPIAVSAHSTGMTTSSGGQSQSEAEQGGQFYKQLVSGQTSCSKLEDDEFELMGDFYMERMMGAAAHDQMDTMMANQMGEGANTQMHVAMAKRLSGCDLAAAYPAAAAKYQWLSGITGMGMMSSTMMGTDTNTSSAPLVSDTWAWALVGLFVATVVAHLLLMRRHPAKQTSRKRK